jgi:hypothetical protein
MKIFETPILIKKTLNQNGAIFQIKSLKSDALSRD